MSVEDMENPSLHNKKDDKEDKNYVPQRDYMETVKIKLEEEELIDEPILSDFEEDPLKLKIDVKKEKMDEEFYRDYKGNCYYQQPVDQEKIDVKTEIEHMEEESNKNYYNCVNKVEVSGADAMLKDLTDNKEIAEPSSYNMLAEKSRRLYEKCFDQFMDWRLTNNMKSFSESVLLAYFEELAEDLQPTSLSTHYSMIKCILHVKHGIDVTKYTKLIALLKNQSKGYKGRKSKTFSSEQIQYFLNKAPDDQFLVTKVALIFGITGACGRSELYGMKLNDVKDLESELEVTVPNRKSKSTRSFIVTGYYYKVCKKYLNIRPKDCNASAFLLNYLKGKCIAKNIGINKVGNLGKEIATYLNLPDANLYTGHCFRRTSATLVVDEPSR